MNITRRAFTFAATAAAFSSPAIAQSRVWTSEGEVAVAGGKIHWVSVGEGKPVVLMPKLGGWVDDWRHVAPLLAKNHRVIVIDNPGHGGSVMNGAPPYWVSLPESAAMLMATLDALGIDQCAAGGNSLGGCIVTVAAALWPQKFNKLILLSVALGDARTRAELEEQDKQSAQNYDSEWRPLARPLEVATKTFGVKDQAINDEQNASRAKAGSWVRASERGVGHAGVVNYLPRITASTLLMYGENGNYKNFEPVGLSKIPKARSFHVPNASAFAHQDQPAGTAAAMLAFLNEA
ncbi:MAG: alpha/beta hydrolase [Rhodospirillaceae bacterium]|nr:alpha/beta hydrolase [Rhodospirillaceae bacterium]